MDYKETKFIEEKDIKVLKNLGVEYENDIKVFLLEIRNYFNSIWQEKHYINNNIKSIDELNEKHLSEYPSTTGYYILESSFTGNCPTEILSVKSKIILGYLYNINLH